jgi:hypothetical protein
MVYIPSKKQIYENTENELNHVKNLLNNTLYALGQDLLELEQLQQGDIYTLHDPIYEEVTSFIENDTSSNVNNMINLVKQQGLRCAFVQVVMTDDLYVYELIGFYTIDKGMTYFESNSDYQVKPEIGKKYVDCVIGHPYKMNTFNDTIVDILVIW